MNVQEHVGFLNAVYQTKDEIFSSEDKQIIGQFESGPASVSYTYRQLFPMEQFANVTIDLQVTLPCPVNKVTEAAEYAKSLAGEALTPVVQEIAKRQEQIKAARRG